MIHVTTVLVYALAIISFYLIRVAANHSKVKSISDSDYVVEKPWRWTFEVVMFITGTALIYVALALKNEPLYILWVSGICNIGVGIFSRFKDSQFNKIAHYVCAYATFISIGLSIAIEFEQWMLFVFEIFAAVFAVVINRADINKIWRLETLLIYLHFIILETLIIKTVIENVTYTIN